MLSMDWRKWITEYFNFTRKDRIGILTLAAIIIIVFFLPHFLAGPATPISTPDTAWTAKLRELEIKQEMEEKVQKRDTGKYARRYYAHKEQTGRPGIYRYDSIHVKKTFQPKVIDINTADTTAFISLPGIGSKLASRIANFREKLGGFYSIEQLGEVYGLQDSVFQKIRKYLRLNDPSVKKININIATVDELKAHPYIKYNIANAIIAYRNQHGPFSAVEDIKKIMVVTEELYSKMLPYFAIQ
jgi:competence ComEA-like helix-hairpin-helix protein